MCWMSKWINICKILKDVIKIKSFTIVQAICMDYLLYYNYDVCFFDNSTLIYMWKKLKNRQLNVSLRVQFSSVAQSCPTPYDPMTAAGFLVHHQLLELTQTHVYWVGDAIQPSHPLLPPSPPTFNLSQHQDLFKWVSSSHQEAKILEFQLQHQSFQWVL